MMRSAVFALLLAVPLCQARADTPASKPAPKLLLESWQAAYFEGLKVGHMHTRAEQLGQGETARIRTTRTMDLVIKRYGGVVPIQIGQTSEETLEGKVLALGLTQMMGMPPKMTFQGTVADDQLVLKSLVDDREQTSRKVPFPAAAMGLYAQETIFQRKKAKPGDKVELVSFEILLSGPLTVRGVVRPREKVDQLVVTRAADGKVTIAREPVSLLRVDATSDPVTVNGVEVKLPAKVVWLDAKLLPVREQFEMPGLGTITFYTTSKEAALKEGVAPERLPDLGLNVNIPLKQTIDEPYATREATYKVTMKEKLAQVFTTDDRQQIQEPMDKTFELVVKAQRAPGTDDMAASPGPEYLESNVYVDSDDARIKALAKAITRKAGDDPWKRALVLERWVHENMKLSTTVGFPNASQIARDLEGDCRQHAMLLAALTRAVGIPSRSAIGLIYIREAGKSPNFGFHMWTEVWIKGKWIALDAVLGQGGVGATHLKMAHHSWAKTQTLAPLLPISQTLGKLQIEILSAK
ncbi:MAG: transglutaminase-like domain-containing protein [Gemmataceae bacterium]